MSVKRVVATTNEQLETTVYARTSPLATPPDWAIVPVDENEPASGSAVWVAGSWGAEGWSARTGLAVPVSAQIGEGQAHPLVRGMTYKVFVRHHVGTSDPVKFLGLLAVD